MEKFEIITRGTKHVRRFRLSGTTLVFKIKKYPANEDPIAWVKDAMNPVVHHVCQDVEPQDKIGFTFCSGNYSKDGWINFTDAANISAEDVWGILETIFQSNSSGLDTDTFRITATVVRLPRGRGRVGRNKYNNFEEECARRKGIISISNKDNYCLPRAIVVGMAYVEKNENYKRIIKDTGKIQTNLTNKLLADANVIIPNTGAVIPEIIKIQDYIKDKFKITVYDYLSRGRSVIFEGPCAPLKINLLFHNEHYNVITSVTSAFGCGYFCEQCHVPYYTKNEHRCGGKCPACLNSPSCILERKIICEKCNRWFRNEKCYETHLKNSVCNQLTRCNNCLKTTTANRTHFCGEIFCKICKKHVLFPHLCYMKPVNARQNKETLFIFYDLETTQEKVVDETSVQHVPNLCVFKQCCAQCLNTNKITCEKCGYRTQTLWGSEIIEGFLQHILNIKRKFQSVVAIAHNGESFDHQFVLNYILTKTDLSPRLILRGTKIISMTIGNVKFLDSINYFPMSLAELPNTFGLGANYKKGIFPYLFNTEKNQNYVGTLPDISYYSPDTMKPIARENFLSWYEKHKNDTFDMRKEILEYCVSDVNILAEACLKFREQLLKIGNVCPFTEATTIASTCNKVFRRNFFIQSIQFFHFNQRRRNNKMHNFTAAKSISPCVTCKTE